MREAPRPVLTAWLDRRPHAAWAPGREYGRPFRRYLLGMAVVAALPYAIAPLAGTDYVFDLGTQTSIYVLATMGLSILYGWAGQLSLAHAGFFGLGAYVTAYLRPWTGHIGIGGQAVELAAVIGAAIVAGIIVGLPAVRVSGLQLAVVTLSFALVFQWALIDFHSITHGDQGLIVGWFTVGGFSTTDPRFRFVVALVLATVGGLAMIQLHRTPLGRAMSAVRDSELAAQSVGVVAAKAKLHAFVISAVYAGVAGWMFAYYIFAATPGSFTLFDNVYFLVAVILGGRGLVLGAWLGGAYLVLAPDVVRSFGSGNWYPVVSGVLLVIVVLTAPGGFAELPAKLLAFWRRLGLWAPSMDGASGGGPIGRDWPAPSEGSSASGS